MPLKTEIRRDDEPLAIPWGGFHVSAMVLAIIFETNFRDLKPPEDIDYPEEPARVRPIDTFTLMDYGVIGAVCPEGEFTLESDHKFEDAQDGEIFELKPGDKLRFWRSYA